MGKFRKEILISCITLSLIVGIGISLYSSQKNTASPVNKQGTLAMYIEDESGNYQLSNAKEFPKERYVLNLKKSSCKNGGTLSQNPETLKLNTSFKNNDLCNIYFKKGINERVLIIWNDEGEEENRPKNISVDLYRDGEVYYTGITNLEKNWRLIFTLDSYYSWQIALSDGEIDRINASYDYDCDLGMCYQETITREANLFTITFGLTDTDPEVQPPL